MLLNIFVEIFFDFFENFPGVIWLIQGSKEHIFKWKSFVIKCPYCHIWSLYMPLLNKSVSF